jgi:hypothetical protein
VRTDLDGRKGSISEVMARSWTAASAEWYDTSRRQSRTPPAMSVVGGDVRLRASTGFCTQWAEKMSMEIPS